VTGGSEHAFAFLEATSGELSGFRVRESDVTVPAGRVLHALDTEGRRHLLVPLEGDAEGVEDHASAGVQIVIRELVDAGQRRRFADAVCQFGHLRELFSVIADEMLQAVTAHPGEPALGCRLVLERWRELLERPRSRLLGPDQLAGLYAELRFLRRLVAVAPARALSLWTGPWRSRFDFLAGEAAVEVKASTGTEGRRVEIHGDRQLEEPTGGTLHLLVVWLERVTDGGENVPDLVDALLDRVDRFELLSALQEAGYDHADAETYRQIQFSLREEVLYQVDEAFPRIVPSSFATGVTPHRVTHLRYRIDLDGEPPSPLPAGRIGELAAALAGAAS
jgi:hypothetical protein